MLLRIYTIKPKVGGPTKKVHRNNIMNCNLLLREQLIDKSRTSVPLCARNVAQSSAAAKKSSKSKPLVAQNSKCQLPQPHKKKHVLVATPNDDSSSSDDELVLVATAERGEEEGTAVTDVEDVGEPGDDDLDATVPYAEKDVEGYRYDVDSETEEDENTSQTADSVSQNADPASHDSEAEPQISDVSEQQAEFSSEATDSDSDTSEELR